MLTQSSLKRLDVSGNGIGDEGSDAVTSKSDKAASCSGGCRHHMNTKIMSMLLATGHCQVR